MSDISNIPKIDKQTHHSCYNNWISMKRRCYYEGDKDFHNYGGRGIKVCDRWKDNFSAFIFDMGVKPSPKHSVDRIDNNKNYEPENCRWSTMKNQGNNRRTNIRFTYQGESLTIPEWEAKLGLSRASIYQRLKRGFSVEYSLTTPVRVRKRKKKCLPKPTQISL